MNILELFHQDAWRTHQMIVGAAMLGVLTWQMWNRFGLLASKLFMVCLGLALALFSNPNPTWGNLQHGIDTTSAIAAFELLLYATLALTTSVWLQGKLMDIVAGIAVLDAVILLFHRYGFCNNSSMDAAFIALCLPRIMHYALLRFPPGWAILIPGVCLGAIVKAGGSAAYFMLAAQFGAMVYRERLHLSLRSGLILSMSSVGIILGGFYILLGNELFNPSGRFNMWRVFFDWWWLNANPWIGTGTGTFQMIGHNIQRGQTWLFFFMHNEYLQVLFEQGVIGLTLGLGLLAQCFYRAWHTREAWLITSWVGLTVMMLAQYPFRFALPAFYCALLAARTLRR